MTGTPAKLRDGNWGARIPINGFSDRQDFQNSLHGDETVEITTRNGRQWTAGIGNVIWVGKDRNGETVALVRTVRLQGTPSPERGINGSKRGRLVGYHGSEHCSCGNWSGVRSACLYSYSEAKEEDEHRNIDWVRE